MYLRHMVRLGLALLLISSSGIGQAQDSRSAWIQSDYDAHLEDLFVHFHKNPELSMMEFKTAARLAQELRDAGFDVTEGVGGTGLVAVMRNGTGPTVMMRADMDGLP